MEDALEHARSRIELADFFARRATRPCMESADRGQTELLDYRQLYELWERQQWLTQELDFIATASTGRIPGRRSASSGCTGCRRSSSASRRSPRSSGR